MTKHDQSGFKFGPGRYEVKEADQTPAGGVEVKKVFDELMTTFEAFKQKNDEMHAKQGKRIDSLDLVTLDNINEAVDAGITKTQAALADYAKANQDRIDGLEVQMKRTSKGGDVKATAEREAKGLAFFQTIYEDEPDFKAGDPRIDLDLLDSYGSGFVSKYLRHTGNRGLDPNFLKDAQIGGDPAGGFTVPPDMLSLILEKEFDTSNIRSLAMIVTTSRDRVVFAVDRDDLDSGWVGETSGRPTTATPKLGEREIPVHEIYAQPRATQNLIDDSVFNVQEWLTGKVSDHFGREEETAFVTGDGVSKPRGFMDYSSASVLATAYDDTNTNGIISHRISGNATTIDDPDPLVELTYDLKPGYRDNARWILGRQTLSVIRKLKDANNLYIWQPNIQVGQPGSLLGFGISEAEDMPVVGAGTFPVNFANMRRGYMIVDRQGMRLLVDPFTAKPYVLFYMTKRVGGDVIDFEAHKFLKISA